MECGSSTDLEAVTRGGHSFSLGSRFKPPRGLRDAARYAASISRRGHLVTRCSYSTAALDCGSTPVCPLSLSTCLLSAKFETGIPITETAEADSNRGPSAYPPNALPLGPTGSLILSSGHTLLCNPADTCHFHVKSRRKKVGPFGGGGRGWGLGPTQIDNCFLRPSQP